MPLSFIDNHMQIEKAEIKVLDKCEIGKNNIIKFSQNEVIKVQFNPNEYSITSNSNFSPKSAGEGKKSEFYGQFSPIEANELSIKFFFDSLAQIEYLKSTGNKSCIDINQVYINKLLALSKSRTSISRPPIIVLSWGDLDFKGFVKSVTVNYMRFNNTGNPIRAEVSMSIIEADHDTMNNMKTAMGKSKGETNQKSANVRITSDSDNELIHV